VSHLVVLANLAILALGLGLAGKLLRLHREAPSPAGFWQLLHFLSLTFTMAVAALGAYSITNIGFGPFASRLYASLVLLGVAALLFCFPSWSRARAGRTRGRRFIAFWSLAAALPAAVALVTLLIEDLVLMSILVAASFVPFFGSVVYGLFLLRSEEKARPGEAWLALATLGLVAVAEVAWIASHPGESGHVFVTLPLSYLYVCFCAWRDRPRPGSVVLDRLPESLAREKALTEREAAMARGILEGKSNKELAYELGIAENTVRNHIYSLYRKLGIQRRLDLVLLVRKYQAP
jgi:DNA-binding CsgD family transcriptional regulator